MVTWRMTELTFRVPWQNLCPDNRKFLSGKFILTAQYRESKEAIALLATVAAKKAKWKRAVGPLGLDVVLTEPDKRVRDAANFAKGLQDALTASDFVLWDDSQIRDARFRFLTADKDGSVDKLNAGATVRIWTLETK